MCVIHLEVCEGVYTHSVFPGNNRLLVVFSYKLQSCVIRLNRSDFVIAMYVGGRVLYRWVKYPNSSLLKMQICSSKAYHWEISNLARQTNSASSSPIP